MPDPNLERLIIAANMVRPILDELVFVGGVVAGLLVTDEGAGAPRPTLDVDAIAEISTYAQYAEFGDRLRALGFCEDMSDGAPLCRWVQKKTILDLMPLDEKILGFSNRWYRAAMERAQRRLLAGDLAIRTVTAPLFVATKLEAFKGRGHGDFLASRDLEDVVFVVDGQPTLLAELVGEAAEIREFIASQVRSLLAMSKFLDALPGYLLPDQVSQSRIGLVLQRLQALAGL